MALASLREQLVLAREHAMRGEYVTSLVFYERCQAQMTKCVRPWWRIYGA